MSYVKRQELFKNINPLLKKYKYDGELPPSYIPANKRAKISTYMGRSSFVTGTYGKCFLSFKSNVLIIICLCLWITEASKDLEMGNKSSKQHAEERNQKITDYTQSLHRRQKEGMEVKRFMNE